MSRYSLARRWTAYLPFARVAYPLSKPSRLGISRPAGSRTPGGMRRRFVPSKSARESRALPNPWPRALKARIAMYERK